MTLPLFESCLRRSRPVSGWGTAVERTSLECRQTLDDAARAQLRELVVQRRRRFIVRDRNAAR